MRCAYCHPDIDTWARCAAALHRSCRAELGRCPTLGCAPKRRRRHPLVEYPDETAGRRLARWRAVLILLMALPLGAAGIVLFDHRPGKTDGGFGPAQGAPLAPTTGVVLRLTCPTCGVHVLQPSEAWAHASCRYPAEDR